MHVLAVLLRFILTNSMPAQEPALNTLISPLCHVFPRLHLLYILAVILHIILLYNKISLHKLRQIGTLLLPMGISFHSNCLQKM